MSIRMMKVLMVGLLTGLALFASQGFCGNSDMQARRTILINNGWTFHKGSQPGAELLGFDDSGWEHVNLPHSASIPYWNDMVKVFEGDTWYRKEFTVEKSLKGRYAFVEFEGAFQHSWVYLNGKLIGEHKGGYTGFSFCMNPALNYEGKNILAVRVRNGWDAQIAPRAGDSIFPNGLNRSVRFVITNPQHVDWCGQFITTPQVSKKKASVRVQTEICNQDNSAVLCTLEIEVIDPVGTVVAKEKKTVTLQPGENTVVMQDMPEITKPMLWSPDHPNLYKVRTYLYNGKKLVDEYNETFGIRWFNFFKDGGFFLNGEHVYWRGFNIHEDRAGWAFAVTDAGMYRDLKMLKKAGGNCVRASHNPHPRAFYKACDELGLLVWDELHFWGRGGFRGGHEGTYMAEAYPTIPSDRPEFDKNLKDNLTSMIKEHRNHPSVIIWSLGNETVMQMKEPLLSEARRMFNELNDLAHQLDPTRVTAIGNAFKNDAIADIIGYNGGNPKTKPETIVCPIMTSEYHHHREPDKHHWRVGAIAWAGFDYGTHCVKRETGTSFGLTFGIYDYHRLEKKENCDLLPYEFKIPSEGTPDRLSLTADKGVLRNDGTDDTHLIISVLDEEGQLIDNDVPVTLSVVSGSGLLPTGRTWKTRTSNMGRQAIELRSYEPGKTIVEVTSPGLKPASVEITVLGVAVDNVTLK